MEALGPKLPLGPLFPEDNHDCCVIGIGRLGLCFAITLERAGYRVVGVDTNQNYVEKVASKTFQSEEPGLSEGLREATNLKVTTNLEEAVTNSKIIFVLVATPTDGGRHYYDHNGLSNVLVNLNNLELKDKSIVICSTVFPGYIRHIGRPLLSRCENCSLNYNPAFVAQGDVLSGYRTGGWFGMVLIGAAEEQVRANLVSIYERLAGPGSDTNICIMSPESAEICKLASNCFRTTKISFANMIGDIADRTQGAEKHEICNALKSDKSIGPICMTPGYGFGGPCYPRDNKALALYAKAVGVEPLIPKATDDYNDVHHANMTLNLLSEDKTIYEFEDVTYKPKCAVPMIDRSPKLEVACALVRAGKQVKIRDRHAVILEVMKEYGDMFTYETVSALQSKDICSDGVY
jgi:UDPglucose 6-dehydrogenase